MGTHMGRYYAEAGEVVDRELNGGLGGVIGKVWQSLANPTTVSASVVDPEGTSLFSETGFHTVEAAIVWVADNTPTSTFHRGTYDELVRTYLAKPGAFADGDPFSTDPDQVVAYVRRCAPSAVDAPAWADPTMNRGYWKGFLQRGSTILNGVAIMPDALSGPTFVTIVTWPIGGS